MSEDQWTAVDTYFDSLFVPSDSTLDVALEDSATAGLPAIAVSPALGKFLQLQVQMLGARRVLEIGTLGGYSTILMARALPKDGRLVTLEASSAHADVARANIARAGLEDIITLHVGRAIDLLPSLAEVEPFDFVFIDADKRSNPEYFEWALKLSRVGTVIVIDNVVRDGAVLDGETEDLDIQGIRRMAEMIAAEPRVEATAIQTVGSKGYDGFALVLVGE